MNLLMKIPLLTIIVLVRESLAKIHSPVVCTSNCILLGYSSGDTVSQCEHNCTCTAGKCNMSKCKYNCSDYSGSGTNMKSCTKDCKCIGGNCDMSSCQNSLEDPMNCMCLGQKNCSINGESGGIMNQILVGSIVSGITGRMVKWIHCSFTRMIE